MSTIADTQAATLQKFIDLWHVWDAEQWMTTFEKGDNFQQVTLPFQMKVPPRSRAEVERVLPMLVRAVKNYEVKIHRVLHDRERGQAAVYAISKGETPFGPWNMEYAVFLTFNEAGDKIATLEEMLDSAHAQWFGPQFQKWIKEQTEQQS